MPKVPDLKPKSFWQRPEGTTGMIFGFGALALGLIAAPYILSYLVGIFTSLVMLLGLGIAAVALGVVLFIMLWVLFDKRFWNLAWYGYKSIMRAITGSFIELDPIGIMRTYITHLRGELAKAQGLKRVVSGVIRTLQDTIAKNKRTFDSNMQLARQAKKRAASKEAEGNEAIIMRSAQRKALRRIESNEEYERLLKMLEKIFRVMTKYEQAAAYYIEDIDDQAEVLTQRRAAINAAHGAFKKFVSIFKGGDDKAEIFNMTIEHLNSDYSMKVGEIQGFMELSESFVTSIDLQNAAYDEQALTALEAWEKKADSLVLGEEKKAALDAADDVTNVLDVNAPPGATNVERIDYKKLFE